jgi:leader peptidase (prepilin peptidase)/N-methyltransferase
MDKYINIKKKENKKMENLLLQIQSSFEIQLFIISLLGLFVGSFLNVVNYRLPLMEDYNNAKFIKEYSLEMKKEVQEALDSGEGVNLAYPESACPKCSHKIKFYENIPVLSYIFLRGKCSGCKSKISPEYIITEFVHGLLWVGAFLHFDFTLKLCFILPLISIIYSLFIIDLKHKIIFDSYHLLILYMGFLYTLLGLNTIDITDSIVSSCTIFLGIYAFIKGYEKLRGMEGEMFGRGDIKLLGAIGAWLGITGTLSVLLLASLIGFLFFIMFFALNKIDTKNKSDFQMPFGPSIVIAFALVFLEFFNFNMVLTTIS